MMLSNLKQNQDLIKTYQRLDTPYLCVDKNKFLNNLHLLREKIEHLGADLRPHFKTIRAIEAAKYVLPETSSPVTVSTLKEAEALASAGYRNFLYAVGISEAKLPRVLALIQNGAQIDVLLDSIEQARALNAFCEQNRCVISAMLEIDCDDHRGGLKPEDPLLIEIAIILYQGPAHFKGVLTHAGESYQCFDPQVLRNAAANEVSESIKASERIKSHQIPCEVISIGSTPTACSYDDLTGITEVRAGVYSFFDLVMAGVGVCNISDIALSVVATVIGHNPDKGWLFVDAGWMALSSDRGTASQPRDCGYGLIVNSDGKTIEGLQVSTVNQEHGIIQNSSGAKINLAEFPIGSRLHILPNHACATTAMHDHYQVFDTDANTHEIWTRIKGW